MITGLTTCQNAATGSLDNMAHLAQLAALTDELVAAILAISEV